MPSRKGAGRRGLRDSPPASDQARGLHFFHNALTEQHGNCGQINFQALLEDDGEKFQGAIAGNGLNHAENIFQVAIEASDLKYRHNAVTPKNSARRLASPARPRPGECGRQRACRRAMKPNRSHKTGVLPGEKTSKPTPSQSAAQVLVNAGTCPLNCMWFVAVAHTVHPGHYAQFTCSPSCGARRLSSVSIWKKSARVRRSESDMQANTVFVVAVSWQIQ